MSTAGKVLTVLILLVMMGWIVMLSAVTQLNANWTQRIAKAEKDLEAATAKIAAESTRIVDLTDQGRAEQAGKDRDLREVQSRIVATEGRLSSKVEDLTRVQFQLADYEAAVKKAETNLATRKAELAKANEDFAAKKAEIAQKQEENAQLRDQLARLQDDFRRLLNANTKQIRANTGDRPESQPASDRRPSPAS